MKSKAKYLLSLGLNPLPCNNDKIPIVKWDIYKKELINDVSVFDNAKKIGIVCGKVSGNLEVLDFDLKNKRDFDFDGFIKELFTQVKYDFPIVKTINNGYHIYYKCDTIESSQQLAKIYRKSEGEVLTSKTDVLIETRGEGGQVISYLSDGYELTNAIDYSLIPTITPEDRDIIFSICRAYNEVIPTEKHTFENISKSINSDYIVTPFDDFNRRFNLVSFLEQNGWRLMHENDIRYHLARPGKKRGISATIRKDSNIFHCYSTSTEFDTNKSYMSYQVYAIINNLTDYKHLAHHLLKDGYGIKSTELPSSKYNKIQKAYNIEGVEGAKKEMETLSPELQKYILEKVKTGEKISAVKFWDEDKNNKPKINEQNYLLFLQNELGLSIIKEGKTTYRLVRNENNIIKEVNSEEVKKLTDDWIKDNQNIINVDINSLTNALIRYSRMFSNDILEWLPRCEFNFIEDEPKAAYFFYLNKIVKVTPDKYEYLSYCEIAGKTIWETQLIGRNFEYTDQLDTNFIDFTKKISGEKHDLLKSILGYNLHRYKDERKQIATFIGEEVDDSALGGGAGKGILIKSINHIFGICEIDGEQLANAKNFVYQSYQLGQPLIAINDASKNTNWDSFKPIISDGLTVDKKNKDQLFIPYKRSPKILFTSNYTLPTENAFIKRRFKILTLKPYFNKDHTPEMEYDGELFFSWDEYNWRVFDNFMMSCVQFFLKHGFASDELPISFDIKNFKNKYDPILKEFLDNVKPEQTSNLKRYYELFLKENALHDTRYKYQKFRDGLFEYKRLFGLPFEISKNPNDNNSWWVIKPNEKIEDELAF